MSVNAAVAEADFGQIRLMSIDSDLSQAHLAAESVRKIIDHLNFETADSNKIELAFIESVNNCIEHSYKNKPGNTIDIEYKLCENAFKLTVIDDGPESPILIERLNNSVTNSVSKPVNRELDIDSLPVSGWGLMLIKTLCDDVSYLRNNNRNFLTLSFSLS